MASIAVPPAIVAPPPRPVEAAVLGTGLLGLFATLLGFTLLKHGTDFIANDAPQLVVGWAGAIGALSLAFLPAGYAALPRFAARCLRASSVFLALYFAIEPFAIPYAAMAADHPAVLFHGHARWIGCALAVAGLFRPSLAFASAMVLWMMRELQTGLTGFYFSTLDIRNVAEVIAFWAIGFSLVAVIARSVRMREKIAGDASGLETAASMILAAGIGAHLANYFWSGLAKLALDGGPLSWLLDNRLYDGIPAALEKGTLPLAAFPAGVAALDLALRWLMIPINLLAFAAQIAAIAAPLRRRWLILSIVAFDAFHLVVWLTLGLLFWKWIALNAIILVALAALRDEDWTRTARTTAIVFVIAGMATFRTASLAWYESPGFASPYFVARMDDGRSYRIPNAYFLSSSYQVSQGKIWAPAQGGHFNPSIWGSVLRHDDLEAGRACDVPATGRRADDEGEAASPAAIGRFVRAHHRQILPRLDARGRFDYYLVPHHHVPSLGVADPFYAADKRRIARYSFVLDSVCLSLDHGRLVRRLRKRTVLPVYDVKADRIAM
ncbi:MAG TPA: hypothetical protein VJM34_15640 [Novosphingobium sp.]|nr:hypothetical protein [Novosphingobium sp.]